MGFITFRILGIADLTVVEYSHGRRHCRPGYSQAAILLGAFLAILAVCLPDWQRAYCTKLKIPALLSGILTMIALYSINLRILGKANLSLLRMNTVFSPFKEMSFIQNKVFAGWGISHFMAVIIPAALCVLGIIILLYWFFGTEIGSAIRATGNNFQMARAQGINTNNMIMLGLIISNGLVALSGALIAQQQGFADIQMGIGSIVIGLASFIIGKFFSAKGGFSAACCPLCWEL